MAEENKEKQQGGASQPWHGKDIETIVSIDFGSFGFAASYCPIDAPSHQRIIQDWSDARAATELNKNLAALLIDKATKETVAMGYEAEELYTKAQEKKEDGKYMYFEHFKPYLYSTNHLNKNVDVPSADGTTLKLAELITKSLTAVVEHTLSVINGYNKLAGIPQIDKTKVYWVISVPAIWDEMSKEMMKKCAKRSGMKNFELGSEPIVSTFHVLNSQGKDFRLKAHDKIMILDCGGGTIDAACIEIESSQYDLSELHHGDGIRAGGLDVDKKYIQLVHELLPEEVVTKVKKHQPAQWMRQKNEFVLAKFSCKWDLEDRWNVPFCYGINNILAKMRKKQKKDPAYKKLKSHIEKYEVIDYEKEDVKKKDDKSKDDDDKEEDNDNDNNQEDKPEQEIERKVSGSFALGRANLRINKKGWLYLHEEVLLKIVNFVRELFKNANLQNCQKVIVVGGFANSEYLVERLLAEFPDKQFLKPRQPHLAVVRGALYWICQRRKLKKTRAKYSYGIAINRKFRNDTDPKERRIVDESGGIGAIVENAFGQIVERNEEYEDGYKETFDYYIPANSNKVEICLYASEDPLCRYVFDKNPDDEKKFDTLPTKNGRKCFQVKKFVIPINNPNKEPQAFQLRLEYNQNGINLFYTDPNTDKEEKVEIDLDIGAKK